MVSLDGAWRTVDSRSWGQSPDFRQVPRQAALLCQKLKCGAPLALTHIPYFSSPQNQITCQGQLGSFSSCNSSRANQGDPLSLICLGECP